VSAHTRATLVSLSDVTSLTIDAPASIAARAISAFEVSRDDHVAPRRDRLNQRKEALALLFEVDLGTRTRFDPSEIEDRGPLLHETERVLDRLVEVGSAPVVERIRRSIHDPHHETALQRELPTGMRQSLLVHHDDVA